jgi:hypothetical protein
VFHENKRSNWTCRKSVHVLRPVVVGFEGSHDTARYEVPLALVPRDSSDQACPPVKDLAASGVSPTTQTSSARCLEAIQHTLLFC